MERYLVGRADEFQDLKPVFIDARGLRIAVYRFDGKYYAYLNWCPHQGGPACEGLVFRDFDCKVENGIITETLSHDRHTIACPWHGVEYHFDTGKCVTDEKLRLKAFDVEVDNGQIFVKR